MAIPVHRAHIYQKPKAGTGFINRYPVYNYKHSINAIGGFDTASCDIAARSVDEAQQFLDQYIGNMVRFFVDNPVEPIWEGFINRMTFNAGGTQYTISLDQMANRLTSHYSATLGSTNTTQTTASNNTNSQAVYGIKNEMLDLGIMQGGTGTTLMQNTLLAQKAWPQTSRAPGQGGTAGLIHIECLGFSHTLEWENYRLNATANVALSTLVNNVRTGLANGATFFDNTDATQVSVNANTIDELAIRGETAWDYLRKLAEQGDGTNYWLVGILPTDFQLGTRRLYYRQFNSAIGYTARQADGLIIRNLYGQKVDPWLVTPDQGVQISDMLIGWNGIGSNPTQTYIISVNYDANSQLATWGGADDTSAQGAFNFQRYNQTIGKRLAAARRVN